MGGKTRFRMWCETHRAQRQQFCFIATHIRVFYDIRVCQCAKLLINSLHCGHDIIIDSWNRIIDSWNIIINIINHESFCSYVILCACCVKNEFIWDTELRPPRTLCARNGRRRTYRDPSPSTLTTLVSCSIIFEPFRDRTLGSISLNEW